MEISLTIITLFGFVLSAYAFYTEKQAQSNPTHKALCDVNDKISCTKAFTSPWGKIFGVPNSLLGIIFYLFIYIFIFLEYNMIVFYLSVLAVLGSVYFAYVLYTKVRTFCPICHGIYLVNLLLLIFSYLIAF